MTNNEEYAEYQQRKKVEFFEKYPTIFPKGEPYCGFDVGYGWWPLLDKLCSDIKAELDQLPEPPPFEVAQVKEKFGGLRFYVDHSTEEINFLIRKAESDSYEICEDCGASGKVQRGSWMKVRCDPCQENFQKAIEEAWRK